MVLSISTRVKGILDMFDSEYLQQFTLSFRGIRGEVEHLKYSVSLIGAVLDGVEDNWIPGEVWRQKLSDALLDVEHLLDELSTTARLHQSSNALKRFFSSSNPVLLKFMPRRIRKTSEQISKLHDMNMQFFLSKRLTHSFVRTGCVIGRDDAKSDIVRFLIDPDGEDQSVSIIPIVGMRGIGKTALAKYVFNDNRVENHFQVKLWVRVSKIFDLRSIMEQIVEGTTYRDVRNLLVPLQTRVHQMLDGNKYLLILDNLCTKNPEEWLSLKNLLMGGAKGSKILITTRSLEVAKISGTVREPYKLASLSKEKSWDLFVKKVFEQGEHPADPEFVSIGKEIVEKCKGIPLAIVNLGDLLVWNYTKAEWLHFKKELRDVSLSENACWP